MGWVAELLLESVAPPSSYLPDRRAKLGMAGRILRGGSAARQEVSTATLRDLAPVYGPGAGRRVVPADAVAARVLRGVVTGLPVLAWLGLVTIASAAQLELELDGERVRLRRWLDHHLRRPGRDLGPAEVIRPRTLGSTLVLATPGDETAVSMRGWPPSARIDAAEELPIWCGLDPGGRPSRRAQRDRRRREAIERDRAEEAERGHHD